MTTSKSKNIQLTRFLMSSCLIFLFLVTGAALGMNCSTKTNGLSGPVKILKQRQYDPSSPWALVAIWEYDQMGKETRVKSGGERDGVPISYIIATNFFNDEGQKIRQITKWNNGSPLEEILYAYDDQGHQKVEAWYDAEGRFIRLDFREFDEQGNCTKVYSYQADRSLPVFLERAEYEYDTQGRIEQAVLWRKDGTKDINRYNEKGNLVEIRFYDAIGQLDHEIHIDYDAHGNQTESKMLASNGKLVSNTKDIYEYDEHKNWVKRISREVIKEGKPSNEVSITDRTITYYDLPTTNSPN